MSSELKCRERNLSLDIIRIIAIFLVLYTHTGTIGNKLYFSTPAGIKQTLYASTDCFRTINNHLLFMISGALLLNKQETIKKIWVKRVARFVITLVLFSYIQAIWALYQSGGLRSFSALTVLKTLLEKPVRLQYWYLYSYISFLVMLPFLRLIAKNMDDRLALYLIIITAVTQDFFPLFSRAIGISSVNFSVFINSFTTLSPLLGYYLVHFEGGFLRKINSIVLIGCIIILPICAASMTIWNHTVTGNWEERYITLFYTVTAISFFEIIQRYMSKISFGEKTKKCILFVSDATFGIYLLENILEHYTKPVFDKFLYRLFPVWIACVSWLVITMVFGSFVVKCLKYIPGLKKLL